MCEKEAPKYCLFFVVSQSTLLLFAFSSKYLSLHPPPPRRKKKYFEPLEVYFWSPQGLKEVWESSAVKIDSKKTF